MQHYPALYKRQDKRHRRADTGAGRGTGPASAAGTTGIWERQKKEACGKFAERYTDEWFRAQSHWLAFREQRFQVYCKEALPWELYPRKQLPWRHAFGLKEKTSAAMTMSHDLLPSPVECRTSRKLLTHPHKSKKSASVNILQKNCIYFRKDVIHHFIPHRTSRTPWLVTKTYSHHVSILNTPVYVGSEIKSIKREKRKSLRFKKKKKSKHVHARITVFPCTGQQTWVRVMARVCTLQIIWKILIFCKE